MFFRPSLLFLAVIPALVPTTGFSATSLFLGEQKIAFIIADQPGMPFPHTPDEMRDILFSTTGPSVDSYWREVSYGKVWATGDVFGPIPLDRIYAYDLNSFNQVLSLALRRLKPQTDFSVYSQIVLVYPIASFSSGWGGHAGVYCAVEECPPNRDSIRLVTLGASPRGVSRDSAYFTILHELTHNLGAGHSIAVDFAPEPAGPSGAAGKFDNLAPSDRAGNRMTIMGGGFGHLEAPMKYHLGWLDKGSGVLDVETGGTFVSSPWRPRETD